MPEDTDRAFTAAMMEVNRLTTQVSDKPIRQAVKAFTAVCTDCVMPGVTGESDKSARVRGWTAFREASASTPRINSQLGKQIRHLC